MDQGSPEYDFQNQDPIMNMLTTNEINALGYNQPLPRWKQRKHIPGIHNFKLQTEQTYQNNGGSRRSPEIDSDLPNGYVQQFEMNDGKNTQLTSLSDI